MQSLHYTFLQCTVLTPWAQLILLSHSTLRWSTPWPPLPPWPPWPPWPPPSSTITCPWSPGSTLLCRAIVRGFQLPTRDASRSASGPRRSFRCKWIYLDFEGMYSIYITIRLPPSARSCLLQRPIQLLFRFTPACLPPHSHNKHRSHIFWLYISPHSSHWI